MKLSECQMGVVVSLQMCDGVLKIGHVVGLTKIPNECNGEVIPVIKFADEQLHRGVHHKLLLKYKD